MWFVDLNSPETDSISHFPQHYPQAYVEKRQTYQLELLILMQD